MVTSSSSESGVIEAEIAGATPKGTVALWMRSGTVAHFRNLTITL